MEQALADRGMDHLISANSEEAGEKFKEAQGEPWSMTDPLLEAFTMMAGQAITNGIDKGMVSEIAGRQICPVCTAMKMVKETAPEDTETYWTGGLADHLLHEYRERGVLTRLQ